MPEPFPATIRSLWQVTQYWSRRARCGETGAAAASGACADDAAAKTVIAPAIVPIARAKRAAERPGRKDTLLWNQDRRDSATR